MTWPTEAKAIFFDLDGTLADSLDVMKMVYRRFLESLGKEPSDAEFARLNGPPLKEIAGILKRTHNLIDEEDQLLSKYQSILDRVYEEVEPAAGALELLQHAKELGLTTAVVTSNGRRRTENWLKRVGLSDNIDDVVTSEDVTKGKPDPEPYLVALKRASLQSTQALAVEDSPSGARAARAAGLYTFALQIEAAENWPDGVHKIADLKSIKALLA